LAVTNKAGGYFNAGWTLAPCLDPAQGLDAEFALLAKFLASTQGVAINTPVD
jgi:hypothetical protein